MVSKGGVFEDYFKGRFVRITTEQIFLFGTLIREHGIIFHREVEGTKLSI